MPERVDISAELRAICALLDVEYEAVCRIEFTPSAVTVTSFVRNDHGSFYLGEDGNAKMETLTRPVVTANA